MVKEEKADKGKKESDVPDFFDEMLDESKDKEVNADLSDEDTEVINYNGKKKESEEPEEEEELEENEHEEDEEGDEPEDDEEGLEGEEPDEEGNEGEVPEEESAEEDGLEDEEDGPEDEEIEGEQEPDKEIKEDFEDGIKEKGNKEEDDLLDENADREEIKKEILSKSLEESGKGKVKPVCGIPLQFLEDEKARNVFIGRKKSVHKKYGYEAALHVGKVVETEHNNDSVFMDGLNPHVVFICGSRGSGKSYSLGVIAEELALKNQNVGVVVFDPIGVFWSMKFPNKEEKEIKMLKEWNLKEQGLKNLRVFIPEGMKSKVPDSTYDFTFAIKPSLLTGEDWSLTFGIDRFSPSGLLMEKTLQKVQKGYKTEEGKKVKGKGKNYSLNDVINCLENDSEINSREKGFKPDSIRALVSRFDAARSWGIFSEKGTPLGKLSKEGQLTILDTSFLDDNVTALVVGIVSRRLLSARKLSTRKEAAQRIKKGKDLDELLELDIPPTWMFIDEAHTLIPSGNVKTPATSALVEYVKQGRRPGCSLVFATQQPSAIDTRVLSQVDIIMSNKLIFDDDIKAVFKRTPTIIPGKYKKSNFIKTLPIGVALVGDRSEETSRAFVMRTRPRMSQHEGRDAETVGSTQKISKSEAEKLMVEMLYRKILDEGQMELKEVEDIVDTLNRKYNSDVEYIKVLKALGKKGLTVGEDYIAHGKIIEDEEEEVEDEEVFDENDEEDGELEDREFEEEEEVIEPDEEGYVEKTELMAFPVRVDEKNARSLLDKIRKKKTLGMFGKEERIESIQLKYRPLWNVKYDDFNRKNEFVTKEAFIDAVDGEFVHFNKGRFVKSKGLALAGNVSREELLVLRNLKMKKQTLKQISDLTGLDAEAVKKVLKKYMKKGLVKAFEEDKVNYFKLRAEIDLPANPRLPLLESLKKLPYVQLATLAKEKEEFSRDEVPKLLHVLWPNVVVRKINEVYWPLYYAVLDQDGKKRVVVLDALTGQNL